MKDYAFPLALILLMTAFFSLIAYRESQTPVQETLQASCAKSCKLGIASFEYHGSSDFKCVCVEPLGVTVE